MRKAAQGAVAPEYPTDIGRVGRAAGGRWEMLCLPFTRNPIGEILSAIALPTYPGYGTRVADLRNLAAATRLTIEARRRGLSGDALAQIIASAPNDQRDVFSGKAFVYDAATGQLRIALRERSSTPGEKGATYSLPL